MSKKRRALVIGHEASLSGAPILLLNLFQLLINEGLVDVQFVIRKGGPLVAEYKKIAPVIVLKSSDYSNEKKISKRAINFFRNKVSLLVVLFKAFSCDYIFCNTIVNGKLLRWLYLHKKRVVTYVHELEKVIDLYREQKDATLPLSVSRIFACPSERTMELLNSRYKIPERKLRQLSYYFPFTTGQYDSDMALEKKQEFREQFGIIENDFVVGGVGAISERKGIKLFIEVCKKVTNVNSSIRFVWIGSFESIEQETEVKSIVNENKLERNLIFTGALKYDLYNFSPFDILFLSSKEDTYPLVVLEAAMMKVPTICFSDSGGIVEFIGDDAGWAIDNFSTTQTATKIIELEATKNEVELRGKRARQKVINLHCNSSIVIKQYNSIMKSIN